MRTANAAGITLAAIHFIGVIWTQFGLVGYLGWSHMISAQYTVEPFNFLTLIVGTIVAGIMGFLMGLIYEAAYKKLK